MKTAFIIAAAGLATTASGQTVNWDISAPTYDNVVNFDADPAGPITGNEWAGQGLTITGSIGNLVDPGFGTWGSDNALQTFGIVSFNFDSDIEAFSVQYADAAGPAGPFSGGFFVLTFDDGAQTSLNFIAAGSTGDGFGNQWLDIVGNGTAFDEVRIAANGNTGVTNQWADNVSWTVPAPASAALLGLGGLAAARRRR